MAIRNELRVFISSTFRDLYEEREHLVKKIFPEIRALCRERGVEFTEIDLRWGLTEEESVQGRIIRSCLEEIDRCRPYFIGVLGERYGWVPSIYDVYKDAELLFRYPWIEDAVAEEVSLIDMEIRYGALNDPAAATGTFFYFRGERPGARRHDSAGSGADTERLEQLKEHIRATGLPVRKFRDPATLGEMVYDDLVEIIERDFSQEELPSLLEEEQRSHAAFAASRRRAYIPNPANLRLLTEHAGSEVPPLVIQAASGSGKSALIAYWAQEYRRRNPDAFIVEHYVGLGAGSADHLAIIHHILSEIRERFSIADDIPDTPIDLAGALPIWLAHVQHEPMILLIDGLNQLYGVAIELTWLPTHIPANVRMIVTTTLDTMGEALKKRGWQVETIPALSREERETVTARFLNEYHKSLTPHLLRQIADDVKSSQPLFLRTLLEELRLYGSHSGLEQRVDWYLTVSSIDELFQCVLQRLEEDFGVREVREVMSLIWASRSGLSETELVELTLFSRVRLSSFVVSLDYHLIRRDGRLNFFHSYLRTAVEQRYFGTIDDRQTEHRRLAIYFTTTPVTVRRADEEPWQWQEAEAWEELKVCLVNVPMFMVLSRDQTKYQLLGYWLLLKDHYDLVSEYRINIRRYRESVPDAVSLSAALHRLGIFFSTGGHYHDAEVMLRQALYIRRRVLGEHDQATAETLRELASAYYYQRNSERAEPLLEQALNIYESQFGERHPETIQVINDLGVMFYDKGEYNLAEKQFTRAIQIADTTLGRKHPRYASFLNNLGTVLLAKHEFEPAGSLFRQVIEITEASLGKEHPEVGVTLCNLGLALRNLGIYNDTEVVFQRAIRIFKRTLGPVHPRVVNSLQSLRNLYQLQERQDDMLSIKHEVDRIQQIADNHG